MENVIKDYPVPKLLTLLGDILDELGERGVVRSRNNPVADYAEWIVSRALNLKLQANSTQGFDALDSAGMRYEIKGRRLHPKNESRQLSFIRNLDKQQFDILIGVLFWRDFSILEAYKIPHHLIGRFARYSSHANGHLLVLKGDILVHPEVERIDALLREFVE